MSSDSRNLDCASQRDARAWSTFTATNWYSGMRQSGIEVVAGDLDNQRSIEAALADVDRIVLVGAAVPSQEQDVIAAAAASRAGTSSRSPARHHWTRRSNGDAGRPSSEQSLLESGVDYTLLRANAYMQNLMMLAPTIATTGGFAASTGRGQVGLTDARAVGAMAAAIVPTRRPCGGDLLDHRPGTAFLRRHGRHIDQGAEPPNRLHRTRVRPRSHNQGWRTDGSGAERRSRVPLIADGDAARLSEDLPMLFKRPARDFHSFAREHAAQFTGSAQAPHGG